MNDPDLSTDYLGLKLRNPVVASASTVNANVGHLVALQTAGIGAVVLPSLFEEQIRLGLPAANSATPAGAIGSTAAQVAALDGYNAGIADYLTLISEAAAVLDVPVIASLNGTSSGGWTSYAARMEDAGADALELNIYMMAADPDVTGAAIEDQHVQLVEAVRSAVSIPIAVKLGPYFSSPANMARRIVDAGADGLVMFNRFYQPDVDVDAVALVSGLELSSRAEMRLVLRWMALLHGRIDASLAATTGVRGAEDVVKLILAGADVVMTTSALLRHGADYTATIVDGVRSWLIEHDHASIAEVRGLCSELRSPDASALHRANYTELIANYVPYRHAR